MIQIINDFISEEFRLNVLNYLNSTDEWKDNPSFEQTDIINIYDDISLNKDELFKLKPLSFYFIRWKPGSYLDFHSDNSNLDGTDNGFSHLKHAAMVYLNNDFDGGEIIFQKNNFSLKPMPRSFVAFDGGTSNIHAVNDITSGVRYVIGTFWDYIE